MSKNLRLIDRAGTWKTTELVALMAVVEQLRLAQDLDTWQEPVADYIWRMPDNSILFSFGWMIDRVRRTMGRISNQEFSRVLHDWGFTRKRLVRNGARFFGITPERAGIITKMMAEQRSSAPVLQTNHTIEAKKIEIFRKQQQSGSVCCLTLFVANS